MKTTRVVTTILVTLALAAALLPVGAQEGTGPQQRRSLLETSQKPIATRTTSVAVARSAKRTLSGRRPITHPVIPAVTVLNNPEYISGEASISVAANSNPLIRIGIAQNGVTLIEFPATDKFFAVHAGNSDLVTVEKSPTLKRDHHLVLRAGSGFLVPAARAKGSASTPATSIIAQMDSGMAITFMLYPVPILKQQAHRVVIKYSRDEVVTARQAAGLAVNLVGPNPALSEIAASTSTAAELQSSATLETTDSTNSPPSNASRSFSKVLWRNPAPDPKAADYKDTVQEALDNALKHPQWFRKWADQRHGLKISTLAPRDLSETTRLVLFAVANTGSQPLRLIPGYPDLYIETLNEKRRPVEAGTRIDKLYQASSPSDNLLAPGTTRYFALAYEAPILGKQQHLKILVAHSTAADEPATADLTSLSR